MYIFFPVGTTFKTEKTETEKMGWNETYTFPSQRDTFFSFSFLENDTLMHSTLC